MEKNSYEKSIIDSNYCFILGTRAELIKTAPVMRELNYRKIPYYFISTGQHDLETVCNTFMVKCPDVVLSPPPEKSSKFNSNKKKALWWNFTMYFKIQRAMKKLKNVKYVLYHGDTMTTCTTSIALSWLFYPLRKWKNVHLEAGLRSFDWKEPFPEEISRVIADRFSDILFVPSNLSMKHLKRYRKDKYKVGNTIIDSATYAMDIVNHKGVKMKPVGEYMLVTIHRHENIKSKERMTNIVDVLKNVKQLTYFMVHSNTRKKLEEFNLWHHLVDNENVILCEPVEYSNFLYFIASGRCKAVICDGGSMQEECLLFKVPCIILRKKTERQEGCETGWQYLTEVDPIHIENAIDYYWSEKHLKEHPNPINPYGKVGVSKKIIDILEK